MNTHYIKKTKLQLNLFNYQLHYNLPKKPGTFVRVFLYSEQNISFIFRHRLQNIHFVITFEHK